MVTRCEPGSRKDGGVEAARFPAFALAYTKEMACLGLNTCESHAGDHAKFVGTALGAHTLKRPLSVCAFRLEAQALQRMVRTCIPS